MDDTATKGYIDLSEVESVKAVGGRHVQSAPKKADENAFFEVIHLVRCRYLSPRMHAVWQLW